MAGCTPIRLTALIISVNQTKAESESIFTLLRLQNRTFALSSHRFEVFTFILMHLTLQTCKKMIINHWNR